MHLIARIVVVTLVGIAGNAWTARAQEGSGGAAERGKAAYMKAGCYACHGTVGQGGPGGRLAPKPVPQAAFTSFVRKGKVANARVNRNWAGMPPYSAKFLSDAEVADIYAYLSSIPDPPAVSSLPLLSSR